MHFGDLPPASYDVMVSTSSFADAHAEVAIPVSSVREINVILPNKTIAEIVFVNASGPIVLLCGGTDYSAS
jgi:hypothetical protein